MAGRPLLDTDVLVDHLRGRGPGHELVDRLGADFRVSAVTAFELALGRHNEHEREPIAVLLAPGTVSLTADAGLRAGALLRELREEGMGVDVRDAMQAGIALHFGLAFVTRNIRHFARIEGLDVHEPAGWAGGA